MEERNELTSHEALFNGVRLHYVVQGNGPAVLLLHGFPEFWYSWRFQLPALAAAGFRAVAPDLRGYNRSEHPEAISAYHIDHLVEDVAAMLQALAPHGGYLAGHDWGGIIAWQAASRYPELVKRLVILNAPHPGRYMEVLREVPQQLIKSSYVAFFQVPILPERLLTLFHGALIPWLMRRTGINPAHLTWEDAQRYRAAISQPGAARATLNYYRSGAHTALRGNWRNLAGRVTAPTLLLWGKRDVALHPANADPQCLARWVPNLKVQLLDASHWVQMDRPELVNARMIEFLRGER